MKKWLHFEAFLCTFFDSLCLFNALSNMPPMPLNWVFSLRLQLWNTTPYDCREGCGDSTTYFPGWSSQHHWSELMLLLRLCLLAWDPTYQLLCISFKWAYTILHPLISCTGHGRECIVSGLQVVSISLMHFLPLSLWARSNGCIYSIGIKLVDNISLLLCWKLLLTNLYLSSLRVFSHFF